jgi:hypothetical protein
LIVRGTMVGGADGLFRWAKGSERERQEIPNNKD